MKLSLLINHLQEIEEDLGNLDVYVAVHGRKSMYDIDTISSLEKTEHDEGVTITIREVGTF